MAECCRCSSTSRTTIAALCSAPMDTVSSRSPQIRRARVLDSNWLADLVVGFPAIFAVGHAGRPRHALLGERHDLPLGRAGFDAVGPEFARAPELQGAPEPAIHPVLATRRSRACYRPLR